MTLTLDNSGDFAFVDGTDAVTLERETTAKDSSGGVTQTWATVATCTGDLQPASGSVRKRFEQRGMVVSYTIFLSADIGARASDRLRIGARNFQLVEGGYEAGFGNLTGWPATAHCQEIASSP